MPVTVWRFVRVLLLLAAVVPLQTRAEATLDMELGWGGRTRTGRWTPIFVTVADSKPRNAVLELYAPHDATQAMNIRLPIAVGPIPQSYEMLAPLQSGSEPTILSLRETSGKLIKDITVVGSYGISDDGSRTNSFTNRNGLFIGVTGVGPALAALEGTENTSPTVAFLERARIPRTSRGFEALDLLVLNQPDFVSMDFSQQTAIRDWVHAGGRLLLWPGDNPLPPKGPLVGLLPAAVGDVTTVDVPAGALQSLGLSQRFNHFAARQLTPEAGAKIIPLFGGKSAMAVISHRGLGEVTLVNFNASALLFIRSEDQRKFFSNFVDLSPMRGPYNNETRSGDEARAAGQMMDLMGNVPGVGTFGFGYVALVMLGLMGIVGPLDWFVLKWMRRQPWTWVTTSGWIALITAIALSLGSIFRSGDLHFRTVSLVDQVGDQTVATVNTLGLYSPRTMEYRFNVPGVSWWEPMTTDIYGYSRDVIRPLPFQQDEHANVPAEDTVHVWNLRFLKSEALGEGEAAIKSDLWITPAGSATQPKPASGQRPARHVKGTLTNASRDTLHSVWLRTKLGLFDLAAQPAFPKAGLEPGGSIQIDVPLATWSSAFSSWTGALMTRRDEYGQTTDAGPPKGPLAIVRAAGNLVESRSRIIDSRLDQGGPTWAVIYAEMEPAQSAVKLVDETPIQMHWQIVRALVEMREGEPSSAKAK